MHSSDKARRSLCMFSRSFFTASGLLVPDMVPPGPSRSGNGTAGWHCQLLGRWAASRRPSTSRSPAQGSAGGRTAGPGLAPEACPRAPPPPPRTADGCSPSSARSRTAPRGSAGAGSGAHQAGRSLPLPRGPATAGVTKPNWLEASAMPTPGAQTRRRH